MEADTLYVGLDVHKATISVTVAPSGRSSEVRFLGTVPRRAGSMTELVKRLAAKHGCRLSFCYEAGCCGYSHSSNSRRSTNTLSDQGGAMPKWHWLTV